jgi:cytochrome c peroxidase
MDYYNKQLAEAAVAKQREAADYESKYQKTYDEQAAAAKTREQAAVDAFEKSLNTKYA